MKKYLLDTDIVVFLLRNKHNIYKKLQQMSPSQIFVSDVTVAELEYGNRCSGRYEENKKLLDTFLSQVNVVPFADAISLYAEERYRLRKSGKSTMDFDLIIACTSVANNMVMVTNNVSHFERVKGITIENWADE